VRDETRASRCRSSLSATAQGGLTGGTWASRAGNGTEGVTRPTASPNLRAADPRDRHEASPAHPAFLYNNLCIHRLSAGAALREAQRWLRDATDIEMELPNAFDTASLFRPVATTACPVDRAALAKSAPMPARSRNQPDLLVTHGISSLAGEFRKAQCNTPPQVRRHSERNSVDNPTRETQTRLPNV
jgi:hypothetical protein